MNSTDLANLRDDLYRGAQDAAYACRLARDGFEEMTPAGAAACALHLSRFYSILEEMARRVVRLLGGHAADGPARSPEVISHLSCRIHGVGPPLFPEALAEPLGRLRDFRDALAGAHDLQLARDKLAVLVGCAGKVAPELLPLFRGFIEQFACQELPQGVVTGPEQSGAGTPGEPLPPSASAAAALGSPSAGPARPSPNAPSTEGSKKSLELLASLRTAFATQQIIRTPTGYLHREFSEGTKGRMAPWLDVISSISEREALDLLDDWSRDPEFVRRPHRADS
jgi:hypothetical protein